MKSNLRRPIVATAIVVVLAGCASTSSSSSAPSRATPGPTDAISRFQDQHVAFSYPSRWTPYAFPDPPSSFSRLITFLSTDRLHDPCTVTTTPQQSTTVCAWPVGRLSAAGVLVTWTADGTPTWDLAKQAGEATTIAGRPAKIAINRPGDCSAIGAQQSMSAYIDLGDGTHFYEMDACLNGSETTQQEEEVMTMLSTARVTS